MAERRPVGRGTCAALWAGALVTCLSLFMSGSASAVTFTGRYDGTGSAAGLAMVLSEDGGELHGRIAAAGKDIYLLNGQVDHSAAKGHLTSPGALADFKLEWQPSEVIFTLTPLLGMARPTLQRKSNMPLCAAKPVILPSPTIASSRRAAVKVLA